MVNKFELYLVRHGETAWNRLGRLQGRQDIPLSAKGVSQALHLASVFQAVTIAGITSSPLARAYQTASAIASQGGTPIQTDQRLLERSYGLLEGEHGTDWKERVGFAAIKAGWLSDREHYRIPTGESYQDVERRVRGFWNDFLRQEPTGIQVVVCHNWVKRAFFAILLGETVEQILKRRFGNTAISRFAVTLTGGKGFSATLQSHNDSSHLPISLE